MCRRRAAETVCGRSPCRGGEPDASRGDHPSGGKDQRAGGNVTNDSPVPRRTPNTTAKAQESGASGPSVSVCVGQRQAECATETDSSGVGAGAGAGAGAQGTSFLSTWQRLRGLELRRVPARSLCVFWYLQSPALSCCCC